MARTLTERLNSLPGPAKAAGFALLLAALALAAYSNSFHASFHLDDYHQIADNPGIRDLSNIPGFFTETGYSTSLDEVPYYRPLTAATFALNYAVGGLDVRSFHAFNLILHVVNSLLVLLVAGAVLKGAGRDGGGVPYVVSLLFCLHPVQTGAVTYISGRAVLLAFLFSLSAFYAYMRYRGAVGSSKFLWGVLAPVLFFAGLLSKEMAAGILGAMFLYDLVIRPGGRDAGVRYWYYYTAFLFMGGLYYWMRVSSGVTFGGIGHGYTPLNYLMSELKVIVMYIRLLLFPVGLNADHALPLTRSADLWVVLSAVLIGTILLGLARIRKAAPAESFMGLFFFVMLIPESSVFPILDIAVEYRLYLPSVGFLAMAVLLAGRVLRTQPAKIAVCMAVLTVFGVLTLDRNRVYATEYTYWSDVASKSPQNIRAHLYMGMELTKEKSYGEAERILADWVGMRDVFVAEGLACNAYDSLGRVYFETGRYGKAEEVFSRQAELFPEYHQPRYNLGLSLMMLGRYEESAKHLEKALEGSGNSFDIRYNLALVYEKSGRYDEASMNAAYAYGLARSDADRADAERLLARLEAVNPLRGSGSINR